MPPADVHQALRATFLSFGFDIDNRDDVRELSETLRWASEFRKNLDRNTANHTLAMWSVISALLGAIAGTVGLLLLHTMGVH